MGPNMERCGSPQEMGAEEEMHFQYNSGRFFLKVECKPLSGVPLDA